MVALYRFQLVMIPLRAMLLAQRTHTTYSSAVAYQTFASSYQIISLTTIL